MPRTHWHIWCPATGFSVSRQGGGVMIFQTVWFSSSFWWGIWALSGAPVWRRNIYFGGWFMDWDGTVGVLSQWGGIFHVSICSLALQASQGQRCACEGWFLSKGKSDLTSKAHCLAAAQKTDAVIWRNCVGASAGERAWPCPWPCLYINICGVGNTLGSREARLSEETSASH